MENGSDNRKFESVFSRKVRAGKRRTYFFDVRQTKGDDYYVTLTESTRKFDDGGYERHKIFLYKEDFNKFVEAMNKTVDHVKTELLPDVDFADFDRKYEEPVEGSETKTEETKTEETKTEETKTEETVSDASSDLKWD